MFRQKKEKLYLKCVKKYLLLTKKHFVSVIFHASIKIIKIQFFF
jgi:hypothetical protein